MTMDRADLGRRLKYLRVSRRLTQKELAAAIADGLNYTLIGKIERGETMPSVPTLAKLAAALQVKVSYFFGEDAGDAAVLELGRDRKKSWLVGMLQALPPDDIDLVCEIVRLLDKYERLHAGEYPAAERSGQAKAADRKPGKPEPRRKRS